jgi:hypothetical protein
MSRLSEARLQQLQNMRKRKSELNLNSKPQIVSSEDATESSESDSMTVDSSESDSITVDESAPFISPSEREMNELYVKYNIDKYSLFGEKSEPHRPRIPFRNQKDNHKIRIKAEKYLNELAAGSKEDTEALIIEVLRVHHPTLYTKIQSFDDLAENIEKAFKIFKGEIRTNKQLGAKLAVKMTESLPKKKASQLTGYYPGTLQRANREPTTTLNTERVK